MNGNPLDMTSISLLVPYLRDHDDRERNLHVVLTYFNTLARNCELILVETGQQQTIDLSRMPQWVKYHFVPCSGLIHRTALLNFAASKTHRPLVASYDADVLVNVEALKQTASVLMDQTGYGIGFPCNGLFWNLAGQGLAEVVAAPGFVAPKQPVLLQLGMSVGDFVLTHNNALGGCVMFRRDAFLKLGGYNREFVGWGWEDNEIYNRFLKCGLKSYRCASAPLIHLDHFRGEHSVGGQDNYRRFKEIRWMSWRKLVIYINRSLGGCLEAADVRRWRLKSYGRLGGLLKTLMRL